ncbi:hypothetical protein BT96DRAFT_945384 [Gymnopus androsaceus JB14]|uniref:Uncharacterized protein n=1 Tax=Gymnopus androsaceus JB14 TaxID=1447944 RepID=A0A6A4GZL4_9AGAR|nr:hypothetical protein BT96DRAFT_945384 [Gymnopus androsaceus JB14]
MFGSYAYLPPEPAYLGPRIPLPTPDNGIDPRLTVLTSTGDYPTTATSGPSSTSLRTTTPPLSNSNRSTGSSHIPSHSTERAPPMEPTNSHYPHINTPTSTNVTNNGDEVSVSDKMFSWRSFSGNGINFIVPMVKMSNWKSFIDNEFNFIVRSRVGMLGIPVITTRRLRHSHSRSRKPAPTLTETLTVHVHDHAFWAQRRAYRRYWVIKRVYIRTDKVYHATRTGTIANPSYNPAYYRPHTADPKYGAEY